MPCRPVAALLLTLCLGCIHHVPNRPKIPGDECGVHTWLETRAKSFPSRVVPYDSLDAGLVRKAGNLSVTYPAGMYGYNADMWFYMVIDTRGRVSRIEAASTRVWRDMTDGGVDPPNLRYSFEEAARDWMVSMAFSVPTHSGMPTYTAFCQNVRFGNVH